MLALLGLEPPRTLDGRVLSEALVHPAAGIPPARPESETFEASRDLGYRRWRQTLTVSRVGGVTYFDQGNGEGSLK